MRRELVAGQPCEYIDRRFIDGAYRLIPCTVRHLERIDGKPQQVVPCKDGRTVRFLCLAHAGPIEGLKRRTAKRKQPPEEQQALL
jgi:hypothetical protein